MLKEISMQNKPEKKSLSWLAASSTQLGQDPVLEKMKQAKIPLSQENYLSLAFPDGNPTPEELVDLPEEVE